MSILNPYFIRDKMLTVINLSKLSQFRIALFFKGCTCCKGDAKAFEMSGL